VYDPVQKSTSSNAMGSSVSATTTAATAMDAGSERRAAVTRSLLQYGVVAGPFYLAVGLIQAFVRDGFDLSRHPLSVLANGPGGWVQTANFVLTGSMVVAAAIGFARVLGPQSRAPSWFLGAFGVGMLAAAVFRADPVDGFPVGTPLGFPTSVSTSGLLHFVAGGLGFIALAVSGIVTGRALSRRKQSGLARYSVISGVLVAVGFFGGMALPMIFPGVLGIWVAVVAGWAWLTVVSIHFYRVASDSGR
jgi:hypothetical protein